MLGHVLAVVAVVSTSFCLAATSSWTNMWPQPGYDARHSGQSPFPGPKNSSVAWSSLKPTYLASGGSYVSSPVLSPNGLGFFPIFGIVTVYLPTGAVVWDWKSEDNLMFTTAALSSDGGTLYVAIGLDVDPCSQVYGLNPLTGALKWVLNATVCLDFAGPLTIDPTSGDALYVSSRLGIATVANRLTSGGSLVWSNSLLPNGFNALLALSPDASTAYVAIGAYQVGNDNNVAVLLALNASSGAVLWTSPQLAFPENEQGAGSLAVGPDGTVFAAYYNIGVFAFSPSGKQLWVNTAFAFSNYVFVHLSVSLQSVVYAVTAQAAICLDGQSGTMLWSQPLNSSGFASPAVIGADGIVYVSSGGAVFAFNGFDGSFVWSFPSLVPSSYSLSPALDAVGNLYAASTGGINSTTSIVMLQ